MTRTILPHALGNKLIIIIDKYVMLSANCSGSLTFQLKNLMLLILIGQIRAQGTSRLILFDNC